MCNRHDRLIRFRGRSHWAADRPSAMRAYGFEGFLSGSWHLGLVLLLAKKEPSALSIIFVFARAEMSQADSFVFDIIVSGIGLGKVCSDRQ